MPKPTYQTLVLHLENALHMLDTIAEADSQYDPPLIRGDLRKVIDAAREACAHCGRDNADYGGVCTADDCPGVGAVAPELLETCHDLFKLLCDLTHIGETPDEELDEREREIVKRYYDVTAEAKSA